MVAALHYGMQPDQYRRMTRRDASEVLRRAGDREREVREVEAEAMVTMFGKVLEGLTGVTNAIVGLHNMIAKRPTL